MEFGLINHTVNGKTECYPVVSYAKLSEGNNLLLIRDCKCSIGDRDDEKNVENFEIYPVLFIAACKTPLENEIIAAFYMDETQCLAASILSGLPDRLHQDGDKAFLINYEAYLKTCEFTGESKLSLYDFIKERKSGAIGMNTYITHDEKGLNYDAQKTLYQIIDARMN